MLQINDASFLIIHYYSPYLLYVFHEKICCNRIDVNQRCFITMTKTNQKLTFLAQLKLMHFLLARIISSQQFIYAPTAALNNIQQKTASK